MHILLIVSWYDSTENPVSGVFFREQAEALHARGHKVGVLAPQLRSLRHMKNKAPQGLTTKVENGIPTYRWLDWANPLPVATSLQVQSAVARLYDAYLADHGRPDVVHAHSALDAAVGAATTAERAGLPLVITEHSSAFALGQVRSWKLPFIRRAFRAADRRLAVSPALGAQLDRRFRGDFAPWDPIPNIVPDTFFESLLSSNEDEPPRILTVGSLLDNKGHDVLIRAFARAFPDGDAQLRIGGYGPRQNALVSLVRELHLGERVVFLGHLDRAAVAEEMERATLFALASHYETFGVVLAEALASGLPVVATRCGGPEAVVTARDGTLVSPGDIAAFARALATETRPRTLEELNDIRRRARQRFGSSAIVARLEAIYDSAIRPGQRYPTR